MRAAAISVVLLCSGAICFGQYVGVGPSKQSKICAAERAANIDLRGVRQLQGKVRDQSGAAFSDSYAIELRDPLSGNVLKVASLDSKGHFEVQRLSYGRVNLILVLMKNGKPTRTGFESPQWLECTKSLECKLDVVLVAAPTDQPKYQCPLS
ncbi:MAG: hypothetical protein WBY53_02400 [Acidobacteriaceae bacterium]